MAKTRDGIVKRSVPKASKNKKRKTVEVSKSSKKKKIIVEEPESNSNSDIMAEIHNYEVWIYEAFPHLDKYAKKSLDSSLFIPHCAPIPTPTVRETKENYMATLKPYADEVKDTAIDALKANLKGVIVLTSTVQNEEDEVLGDNNSNQPLRILFQVDRKIYREIQLMKTIQHQQSMNMVLQFDEILPLAIVDEALVVIDEYFAEEVNKVVEEMKEEEKEQEEEKMAKKEEEKEGEKLEENEEEKKEEKLTVGFDKLVFGG
ncbi:101 kDa malaria antigen-like [Solanum tuberosum]|uniref:101 kDa malaria antigen-like n=1 Tax=Solanum tuberosum TaxID=4113 RepID=UPI00073A2F38|nr:PREDICTED: 101 kDa malaria antigen-like [Solanum tuberosum]